MARLLSLGDEHCKRLNDSIFVRLIKIESQVRTLTPVQEGNLPQILGGSDRNGIIPIGGLPIFSFFLHKPFLGELDILCHLLPVIILPNILLVNL